MKTLFYNKESIFLYKEHFLVRICHSIKIKHLVG